MPPYLPPSSLCLCTLRLPRSASLTQARLDARLPTPFGPGYRIGECAGRDPAWTRRGTDPPQVRGREGRRGESRAAITNNTDQTQIGQRLIRSISFGRDTAPSTKRAAARSSSPRHLRRRRPSRRTPADPACRQGQFRNPKPSRGPLPTASLIMAETNRGPVAAKRHGRRPGGVGVRASGG